MSANVAQKCFAENRNLFSSPHGTPEQKEKFNLYNGLSNLAEAVQALERQVSAITQALRR